MTKKKYCRFCGVLLNIKKNWHPSCKKNRQYACKKCLWFKLMKPKRKEYNRKRTIQTKIDGKIIQLTGNKRNYKKNCELCHQKKYRTGYHHWDNKNLLKGVWVCTWCHHFIECYEKGFLKKWIKLKKEINRGG